MAFGLQLFLFETWMDPTLKSNFVNSSVPEQMPNYVSSCIWTPDTIFLNIKQDEIHHSLFPNIAYVLRPDGRIMRKSRYRLTVSCPMDFRHYPIDIQNCTLMISLFASTTDKVHLYWITTLVFRNPIMLASTFSSSKFQVKPPLATSHSMSIPAVGNFTFLVARFIFVRRITSSIVNTYIPSLLIVCLSWISFWLDPDAVPGRVTLGVTALLTLATQVIHTRGSLPSLDYMTAVDIWLFGCLIMVFLSLIEFTIANTTERNKSKNNLIDPQKSNRKPAQWSAPSRLNTSNVRKLSSPYASKVPSVILPLSFTSKGGLNENLNQPEEGQKIFLEYYPKKEKYSILKLCSLPCFGREGTSESVTQDNVFDRWARVIFPLLTVMFSTFYWAYLIDGA